MGPWGVEPKSGTIGALFVFSLTPPCSLLALLERTARVQRRRGKCRDPAVDPDWSAPKKNLQTTTLVLHATLLLLVTESKSEMDVCGWKRKLASSEFSRQNILTAASFDFVICGVAALQAHYEEYLHWVGLLNLEETKRQAVAVWCPSSAAGAKQFQNNTTIRCCSFPPDSEIISLTAVLSFYVPLLEREVWSLIRRVWVCLCLSVVLSVCVCVCMGYIYSQQNRPRESVRALCSQARTHHDWAFCLNWHHHTVSFFSYLSLPHPLIFSTKLFTQHPIITRTI